MINCKTAALVSSKKVKVSFFMSGACPLLPGADIIRYFTNGSLQLFCHTEQEVMAVWCEEGRWNGSDTVCTEPTEPLNHSKDLTGVVTFFQLKSIQWCLLLMPTLLPTYFMSGKCFIFSVFDFCEYIILLTATILIAVTSNSATSTDTPNTKVEGSTASQCNENVMLANSNVR